jgi:DNA-binding transcriptional LysR family regulator
MAAAGLGSALLPADQAHPGLVRLLRTEPGWTSELWLPTPPDLRRVVRIRACMEHVAGCLREDPRLAVE